MLLTRLPLEFVLLQIPVRLACVRYAASVHPEPGSNSPFDLNPIDSLLLLKSDSSGLLPPESYTGALALFPSTL